MSESKLFTLAGCFLCATIVLSACVEESDSPTLTGADSTIKYSPIKPKVIPLDLPYEDDGVGGVITVDVNGDGQNDFLVTKPGHIALHDLSGNKLWSKEIDIQVTGKSESNGLPGWHGPGVQTTDVDGDHEAEVLFLTKNNTVHIVEGSTGKTKRKVVLASPSGTERWEHLVVANFRGRGDRDLLLQTTNSNGYRMGRYLAAYALEDLLHKNTPEPLWARDDFVACAHNGARVADLNGDGKDEILGGTIVSPDGKMILRIPLRGHIDSIFVGDVRPDIPGLEVVALEEGGHERVFPGDNGISSFANRVLNRIIPSGNRVFLYRDEQVLWISHYKHQEPQNAAIGDFDPGRPGLEIWSRSRYARHQKPFVFDAQGTVISHYEMDDVAPAGWTDEGVEVIFSIDWTGEEKQLAVAKERHKSGDVAIFDPITGRFLHRFKEKADRLYVADVLGDWREEIVVLNGRELHIYSNENVNPNPHRQRLWEQDHYLRSKMTWNYYSP